MIPDTQMGAFSSLDNLGDKRQKVAEAIGGQAEGATLFELTKIIGWPVNRISGRVTELAEMSVIFDSGVRRKNPASGRPGIVWMARKAA